jgi:hypothetical protein
MGQIGYCLPEIPVKFNAWSSAETHCVRERNLHDGV